MKLPLFSFKLLFLFIISGFLIGCAVNPVTGQKELTLMSASQEVAIGTKNYSPMQQSQGGRYIVDPNLTVYVNEVGQRIASLSDRPGLPYEFVVLNNDTPNAWALPGGKIAINRGLLVHLEDEAQLAAVLAHEVVHAAAKHSAQQMTQATVLGIGTQIVGAASANSEYGQIATIGAQLGASLYSARYGRSQELEADAYGIKYMVAAGYDPMAAVELQETFVKLSQGRNSNWLEGLFASHPPSHERVSANKIHARPHQAKTRNRSQYQRAMRQVTRDKAAYALHGDAKKAMSNSNPKKALDLVEQAIAKQPREPLFWVTKGQFALSQQTYKTAHTAFSKANQLYPEYALPLIGKGIAAKNLNRLTVAEADLTRSLEILPTQPGLFYLAETKLALKKSSEALRLFQQARQGGGALGQKSQEYIERLQPNQASQGNSQTVRQ